MNGIDMILSLIRGGLTRRSCWIGCGVAVTGIDVHPVAVHLARAAWALAARPVIDAAVRAGYDASGSVPVYLGDALQLRFRTGDMFAERQVTIQVDEAPSGAMQPHNAQGSQRGVGEAPSGVMQPHNAQGSQNVAGYAPMELVFPISLVEQADTFDSLMSQVAADIERGDDPLLALDDYGIIDAGERATLAETIAVLQRLHDEGRDHIWAYYTRNLVRPVALSRRKVDVVIGNPPWLNYNQTVAILRDELERQSQSRYGIWQGGRYASNQDMAGLFYARSVDLYLKDGGKIGMVLPHSALQAGQYAKWRTGSWEHHLLTPKGNVSRRVERKLAVNFEHKTAWDLEKLERNTFFPIASCVVFAERTGEGVDGTALAGTVEQWLGPTGTDQVRRVSSGITDTSVSGESPYANYARQGASIRPRRFFFVEEVESQIQVQAGLTTTVNPRRGGQDKVPWRDLDLTEITEQAIESRHLYNVYLGETVVPYATLEPLKVILPVKKGEYVIPADENGPGGIRLGGLDRIMRRRWQTISQMWEDNKASATRLNLLERIDYHAGLSRQLEWQENQGGRPIRIVYTAGGEPTAALIHDDRTLVDERLYWVICKDIEEANYLLAIINSDALYEAVQPLMSKGQFGARDLHKHLWKLPIPEYDAGNPLHRAVSDAGATAAQAAAAQLAQLRELWGPRLTVTIARRELRAWLRGGGNGPGTVVEGVVGRLLGGG